VTAGPVGVDIATWPRVGRAHPAWPTAVAGRRLGPIEAAPPPPGQRRQWGAAHPRFTRPPDRLSGWTRGRAGSRSLLAGSAPLPPHR